MYVNASFFVELPIHFPFLAVKINMVLLACLAPLPLFCFSYIGINSIEFVFCIPNFEIIENNLYNIFFSVEPGRVILRRGHVGINFYFIYSGSVFVNVEEVNTRGDHFEKTETVLVRGDSFGVSNFQFFALLIQCFPFFFLPPPHPLSKK